MLDSKGSDGDDQLIERMAALKVSVRNAGLSRV
jgi:hypothetical protein